MSSRTFVLVVLSGLLWSTSASAHTVGLSQGRYAVSGVRVTSELVFQNGELAAALAEVDTDQDGRLSATELASAESGLAQLGLAVSVEGTACSVVSRAAQLASDDGVQVTLLHDCPDLAGRPVAIEADFLDAVTHGHRHLASLNPGTSTSSSDDAAQVVLFGTQRSLRLSPNSATSPEASPAFDLFRLGVEHVLMGFDHLVFLLGLVLLVTSLRTVAVIVTAFTVGHSVSLALSTLGVWVPSPDWVEPAIALSIAYIGIENFFAPDSRNRWRLTLLFGTIHGFGFAGILHELTLSPAELPSLLLAFNLGVEVGQLLAVIPMLLLLHYGRRWASFENWGIKALNTGIVSAGVVWFTARVLAL